MNDLVTHPSSEPRPSNNPDVAEASLSPYRPPARARTRAAADTRVEDTAPVPVCGIQPGDAGDAGGAGGRSPKMRQLKRVPAERPLRRAGVHLMAAVAVLVTAGGPGALAVAADWLVTHDGERIETVGPWEVKGKQVIFTSPGGQLSSLRLSQVDVEASTTLTRQAKEATKPATSPAAEQTAPVLVVTDKDVEGTAATSTRATSPPTTEEPVSSGKTPGDEVGGDEVGGEEVGGEEDGPETDSEAEAASRPPAQGLEVFESREIVDRDAAITIVGGVRNNGPEVAIKVQLTVSLLDAEGSVLSSTGAAVTAHILRPGQSTDFRATFTDVILYDSMDFKIDYVPFKHNPGDPATPPDNDSGGRP